MQELNAIYLENDAQKIYQWLIQDMSATMKQYLLLQRNERMCNRLVELIQQKPSFIAVGAGHLGGESGIIALLRKKGYKIENVPL